VTAANDNAMIHWNLAECGDGPVKNTVFDVQEPAADSGPRTDARHSAAPVIVLERPSRHLFEGPRSHVMVVDDSTEILDVMRELLEEDGYRVSTYLWPPPIQQTIDASPDLIVLDVMFQHSPIGLSFLEEIRRGSLTRSIPIVLCTVAADLIDDEASPSFDAHTKMLVKPFDIDQLLNLVSLLIVH
jgi:CheY-like chemotaxis protein